MTNECIVFYESWQMECCGTAFAIGDAVNWLVYQTDSLNTPVDIGKIDYCYEAHSSDWKKLLVLEGKVDCIRILYEKYLPSEDNPRFLVPVDGILIESETAKGFDKKLDGMEANGYLVTIRDYTVRQAEEDEVTFC